MTTEAVRAPRSLADWLRAAPDADLAELLRERPDLITPVPPDLTVLSSRASSRPSVMAALDRLNQYEVEVLEVLCALDEPVPLERVRSAVPDPDEDALVAAVTRLRQMALVWGEDDGLHVIRTVRELVLEPAGLGPPIVSAFSLTSTGRIRDILEALGLPPAPDRHTALDTLTAWGTDANGVRGLVESAAPEVRDVLGRLTWGPPTGYSAGQRGTAVRWSLQRGLLAAQDDSTVVLPREIALALRGGLILRNTHREPPVPDVVAGDPDRCAHAAATHAAAFVRAVEDLLETWSVERPGVLRGGGVGVREVRRTAARLDRPDTEIALLAEVAYAAGLLGASTDGEWLPTPAYDRWCDASDADRWTALAGAWLTTSRVPGLVGARDDRDRALNPLSPELDRAPAPRVRATVLAVLAELPPGGSTTVGSVAERLRWTSPRRGGRLHVEMVGWTLAEAELLGVTGAGALSPAGRLLVDGDAGGAGRALTALLPDPVDYVLLQADLTAVAPGPLTRELARELALVADVESTGHATVYRFSEASVRRALDAGRTAADVHDLLGRHSRTAVPQPLAYLVDDIARRHGRIRVGVASSYVRCDDPAVLSELLGARKALGLGLRRLAATVVAAEAEPDRVLEVLRELGYAPAAESATGDVVVPRRESRRAPLRPPPQPVSEPSPPSDRLLTTAVRALRAGDRASTAPRRMIEQPEPPSGVMPATSSARTLAALQEAARAGRAIWIGYVNAQGRATQRVVEPTSVDGGYLRAYDHLRDELRTFAVHRITGVAELVEDEHERS